MTKPKNYPYTDKEIEDLEKVSICELELLRDEAKYQEDRARHRRQLCEWMLTRRTPQELADWLRGNSPKQYPQGT